MRGGRLEADAELGAELEEVPGVVDRAFSSGEGVAASDMMAEESSADKCSRLIVGIGSRKTDLWPECDLRGIG